MKTGIWLIGARGSLGTTVTAGLAALSVHAAGSQGLVSLLEPFARVDLIDFENLVVGGHDISQVSLRKKAESLAEAGVFPHALIKLVGESLDAADERIKPGVEFGEASSVELIGRIRKDLSEFRAQNNLDSVVVVNVSSTEEPFDTCDAHSSLAQLRAALERGENVLPASSLYAYAALDSGYPFIDFTPSLGAAIPALEELAQEKNVPHAGRDGKTGETLVKTALAPMFASRNLKVKSWAGLNLLGGGDGEALSDANRAASKLATKARSLEGVLGYSPQHPVHIDFIEDLGQWKTAWNHISFEGFMGTQMRMQITWEGCDSALAAPLVIDLVRFVDLARRRGESGALESLGFFFKDPMGSDEHRLSEQFAALVEWATR